MILTQKIELNKLIFLRGLWQFILLQSIAVAFFQSRGLDNGQIFLVQTIFLIILVFLDIPSSILANKFGIKRTMLLGCAIKAIGGTLLIYDGSPIYIYISYILIGVGNAIYSGLDYTMIFESIENNYNKEEYLKKIQGDLHFITFCSIMISGLCGSILANYFNFNVLVIFNAFFAWFCFFWALTIKEIQYTPSVKNYYHNFKDSLKLIISPKRKPLVIIIVISTVLSGIFPYLLQMRATNLGVGVLFFGYLFAFQNGIGALIGFLIGRNSQKRIIDKLKNPISLLIFWMLSFFMLFLGNITTIFLSIFLIEIARALISVLIFSNFQLSFESNSRQVIISIVNFIGRVFTIIITFALSFLVVYI